MPAINAVGTMGSLPGMYAMYQRRLADARQQSALTANYFANAAAARTKAANPSQPELPVQPVTPVRQVGANAAVQTPVAVSEPRLPTVEDLNSASENLARMRIQYPGAATPLDEAESSAADKQQEQGRFNTLVMNLPGIS